MRDDERRGLSRRRVLGGLAGGLGVAMAGGAGIARAAEKASGGGAGGAPPLASAAASYPRPPFPAQEQPWPGLQGKMTPVPDCGEQSYEGSGRLAGRRALVTGGDSGIGRAAAIAFAREGADVAISYLPAEEPDAQQVVKLIRDAGRKAVPLPGDLRSEEFCDGLVANAVQRLGGLDLLVNNAARQQSHESLSEITTEQFDWTLKTNLYALFWITRAALPHLPPGAAIINTTSVNAYDPSPNLLDYAMTKGGIMIFTKALAKQLAPRGIRVNGVAPGPFWTPLQVSGGQSQDRLVQFGKDTPLGRPGQPAELASVYVELAAATSSYVTGQIFGASGGRGNP